MRKKIFVGILLFGLCIAGTWGAINLVQLNDFKSAQEQIQDQKMQELQIYKGSYDKSHIVLSDTTQSRAEEIASALGADIKTTKDGTYAVLYLNESQDIEQVYEDEKNLKYLEEMAPDYTGELCGDISGLDNPSSFSSISKTVNLGQTWDITKGSGTTIAVIDTGIDTNNPYLSSKISDKSIYIGEGKTVADYDISVIQEEENIHHGTNVASAIAADYDESSNTGGLAPETELIIIRLPVDEDGRINSSDVVLGLAYAIECRADVVNMSFSFEGQENPFEKYTKLAVDSDVTCVAAAGDHATGVPVWPAADENVIGVGSVTDESESDDVNVSVSFGDTPSDDTTELTSDFTLTGSSNYGDNLILTAPANINIKNDEDSTEIFNGTSASSAIVSSAIALYISQNKKAEFSDIQDILIASGKDLGTPGIDWYYGAGLLDINALVVEEKGTITYDYLTDELDNSSHVFVRGHILQTAPEPERKYVVFDGWNYDINCAEEYDNLENTLNDDLTVYASWANEDDSDAFSYYVKEDGTAEVTSYRGKRRFVTIPSSIDGYTVTSIGDRAFYQNNRLRQIVLPETLQMIGECAFYNCTRLLSIAIPDNVTTIKSYAFSKCPRLGKIDFSSSTKLTTIEGFAFSECGSLVGVQLPVALENIDGTAFFRDTGLLSLSVDSGNRVLSSDGYGLYRTENGVRSIIYYVGGRGGEYYLQSDTKTVESFAFAYSRLSEVVLPKQLQNIDESAFVYSRLSTINIPDQVTEISKLVFYECSNLKKVTIGSGVTGIGEFAFASCTRLTEIDVPDNNITVIGIQAFCKCYMLSSTDVIQNAEKVMYGAFYECSALKDISLPSSLNSLGEFAFASCVSLENLIFEDGIKLSVLNKWVFNNCPKIKSVVLPEGLTEIGDSCFMVTGLEYIYIPATVVKIGYGAFGSCSNMKDIQVSENNTVYQSVDHVLYETTDGVPSTLHTYPAGLEGGFTIPDSVIKVADYAFISADGLTEIHFGANVSEIGMESFAGCSQLSSVVFNDALVTVGKGAFGSSSIETVTFNDKLRQLGHSVFRGCTSLTNVSLNEGLEELPEETFAACTSLETIEFPSSMKTIGNRCFAECDKITTIGITSNIVSIGEHAFWHDSNLTTVHFAENGKLARLNYGAFSGIGASEITIPSSVSSMAQEVFAYCNNLTTITFSRNSNLTAIAAWMFTNVGNLEQIVFEEGSKLECIEARAFEQLKSLKSIDLSNCVNLSEVGNYAFQNCSNIESILLPESMYRIGRYAFYGCKKMNTFTIPENVSFIGRYAFAAIDDARVYFNAAILPAELQEYWDYGIKGYFLSTGDIHVTTDWKYTLLNDDTAVLMEYLGSDTDVIIDKVDGYPVSVLGTNLLTKDSTIEILSLPDTLVSISGYAFDGASALKKINIPASVQQIGKYAFQNSGIEEISFEEDSILSVIEAYAFKGAEGLKSITLPDSVNKVEKYAFSGSGLQSIILGNNSSLNTIGAYAFEGTNLEELIVPNSLTKIDYHAFDGVSTLSSVEFGNADLKIYGYAFYNTGLTEISIPSNVGYIGEYCFASCNQLTEINVSDDNTQYSSNDGVLFNKTKTKLIQCPAGKTGSYDIPDTTEILGYGAFEGGKISEVNLRNNSKLNTIGYRCFYNCINLTSMYIPKNVVSLDFYAFAYCSNLRTVELQKGSALNGIFEGAFFECEKLNSFNVPEQVIEIGDYAFYGCEVLTDLQLAQNGKLQGIYNHAFDYCSIQEVNLPDTVIEIGDYAFAHNNLTQFSIGSSVLDVGLGVLKGCDLVNSLEIGCLENVQDLTVEKLFLGTDIPETLISISALNTVRLPDGVFQSCSNVTEIEFNQDILYIGDYAFDGCTSIKQLEHMSSILSLGEYAFNNCNQLNMEINLKNIKEIKVCTFSNCSSLSNVTGTEQIERYGVMCFEGCTNLTSISFEATRYVDHMAFKETGLTEAIFSDKIESIGEVDSSGYCFDSCQNLKKVYIPGKQDPKLGMYLFASSGIEELVLGEGVRNIGEMTFALCHRLERFVLPNSVEIISENAFMQCENLKNVIFGTGLKTIEGGAFWGCGKLDNIILTEGLETIGEGAFGLQADYEDWGHNAIWIPASVKSIGTDSCIRSNVFFESDKLPENIASDWYGDGSTVQVYMHCGKIHEQEGLYYFIADEGAIVATYQGTQSELIINNLDGTSINEILDNAFRDNTTLTKIDLGDSIQRIGANAFSGCENLQTAEFGNNIVTIGRNAFYQCGQLEGIVIGDKIESIENCAFYECTELKTAEMSGNNMKKIGELAFYNSGLTQISIPDTLTVIEAGTFDECEKLKEVHLPDELLRINYGAFRSCASLHVIEWNEKLEEIESDVFRYCKGLEEVTLPASLRIIGSNVFGECTGLRKVTLPDGLESIKYGEFYACYSLEEITIPESVKKIGTEAFYECNNLQTVNILGEGLEEIDSRAFYTVNSLERLQFPSSLKKSSADSFCGEKLFIIFMADSLPEGLTDEWDANIKGYSLGGGETYYDEETQFSYYLSGQVAHVYEYLGTEENVVVSEVDGYPISEIKKGTFEGNSSIKALYIGKNVQKIHKNAIVNCKALEEIIFDENCKVARLEDYSFDRCNSLKKLYLSDGIKYIGDNCFFGKKLEEIYMPQNLERLGITSVENFSDSVLESENGLLYIQNCCIGYEISNQNSYTVREGTTAIAAEAFYNCENMKSIVLPSSISYIGTFTFVGTSICSLTIPNSVNEVATNALCAMNKLEELSVPTFGYNGFTIEGLFGDGSYNRWERPSTLEILTISGDNDHVEIRDEFLKEIHFTGSVREISVECPNVVKFTFPKELISINVLRTSVEKIVLPDGLQTIDTAAFLDCVSLLSLEIPESVNDIGFAVLQGCTNIRSLVMPIVEEPSDEAFDSSTYLHSIFGDIFGFEDGYIPESLIELDICGNPLEIPERAFHRSFLKNIKLPDSIKKIGAEAFSGCTHLVNINMPKELEYIGNYAFSGTAIRNICIPETVTYVGFGSFMACNSLESFILESENARIDLPFYEKNASIKNMVIPFVGNSKDNYNKFKSVFRDMEQLETVTLLDSCDNIQEDAFEGIEGINIYCNIDEDATLWPDGWNNGNKVYYADKWRNMNFFVDDVFVYSSVQGIGEAIKLPTKSLRQKADDSKYSYTFLGWDITGDGTADNILATNLKGVIKANAVFSKIEKANMDYIDACKAEGSSDDLLEIDANSEQKDVKKTVIKISSELISEMSGKETTIETNNGNVIFDSNATEDIVRTASGDDITFNMEKVDNSLFSDSSDADEIYDFSLSSSSGDSISFENGCVKITAPYEVSDTEEPIAYYRSEDGGNTAIEAEYDEDNQTVTFTTSHFSLYRISKRDAELKTLTFDTAGGEKIEPIVKAVGRSVTLPNVHKEGSRLVNWQDETGKTYEVGEKIILNQDITLIAQWKEIVDIQTLNDSIHLSFDSIEYNGQEQKAIVQIDGLEEQKDYQVNYSDNLIDAGNVTVTINGVRDYSGQVILNYAIVPKNIKELEEQVKLSQTTYSYDGKSKEPIVSIDGLTEDTDFDVTYSNNVDVGTASVAITGKGNYSGTITKYFHIIECEHAWNEGELTKEATCTEVGEKTLTCTLCGEVSKEEVVALGHSFTEYTSNDDATCTADGTETSICDNGCGITDIRIEKDTALGHDYVEHEAKAATCTEKGHKAYQTCSRCDYTTYEEIKELGHDYVEHEAKAATCTEKGHKAYQTCSRCDYTTYKEIPETGHSFTEYTSNDDATCTADGTETSICDNGCGITDIRIEKDTALGHDFGEWTEIESSSCVDKGSEQRVCKRCQLTETRDVQANGHTWDDDYTIDQEATCIEDGSKSIHCQKCEAVKDSQVISALGHNLKTEIVKATTTTDGIITKTCQVCNDEVSKTIIPKASLMKLSYTTYTYNGAVKNPIVTVKDGKGKTLLKDTEYTVKYASGRKYVGTYKATISLKGNYSGSKTLSFKIIPKGTYISSLSRSKKAFTVKWKKQSAQTTGYQIQYSTSSIFASGNKTVTVTSNKTTSKTIKSLKAKKKYYVRVRTYKTVNGVKYYSGWSAKKYVITKA